MTIDIRLCLVQKRMTLIIYLESGGAFVIPVDKLDDHIKIEPGKDNKTKVTWCKYCDVKDINCIQIA